eukprot:10290227-Alexandrium_andersonii.AAC.1
MPEDLNAKGFVQSLSNAKTATLERRRTLAEAFDAFCTRGNTPANFAAAGYFVVAQNLGPNTRRLRQTLR